MTDVVIGSFTRSHSACSSTFSVLTQTPVCTSTPAYSVEVCRAFRMMMRTLSIYNFVSTPVEACQLYPALMLPGQVPPTGLHVWHTTILCIRCNFSPWQAWLGQSYSTGMSDICTVIAHS